MHIANLDTFVAILECGNMNRAAEYLHVTQSTVNARLNNLEQVLGQPLFHRRKSGAELTAAGFRFERYARLMTDVWRQAQQETALPKSVGSVCNLGCHPDLWQTRGEHIFTLIQGAHPDIAGSAWPGEQDRLNQWMNNGLLDMTVCYTPNLDEKWQAFEIGVEQLIQVATVKRDRIRSDPDYIYVDYGERFRQDHAAAYPDADTPKMTMGSAEWALSYLLETGGSAYLPATRVRTLIKRGRLFQVAGADEFSRQYYLVVNHTSAEKWPWFDGFLTNLT